MLLASPLVHAQTTTTTSTTDTQTIIKLLQEQVKTLLTQVKELQAKLESTNQQVAAIQTELKINRFLKRGLTGEDVKALQTFLSQFPDIYPEGLVTGYYGALTESAVKKWQEKQGIESVGVVGPKTLARINEIFDQGAGQSGTVPSGLLTAPGIEKKVATTSDATIPATTSTSTLPSATTTPASATTTASTTATTTTATTETSQSQSGVGVSVSPTTQAQTTTTSSTSTDTTAPSAPTSLSASAVSSSQISLSWTASTDTVGVTGYKIYRGGTQIATEAATSTSATTYSDTGLQASTAYTYTVAAYDAAGNTSAQSASASATTNTTPLPVSTPSDAPTIASITPYDPIALNQYFISSVTLQWNAVTNPTGYLTYYKAWRKLGSGDWLYWANTQQTTFPDLNIGRGTYYYRVNACHTTTGSPLVLETDVCSSDSNIMTATLVGGGDPSDTTPPSAPTGLTASIVNGDSPHISWTASTDDVGVAGYNIYRNGTYLMSVGGSSTIDGSVSRSTTSSYTVAAYDAAGNVSPQSSPVSPTTPVSMTTSTSNLASVLVALKSLSSLLQQLLSKWSI